MGRISKQELDGLVQAGRVCVVRDKKVYDATDFVSRHPGGEKLLLTNAGRDVTTLMTRLKPHRHSSNAYKLMDSYYIGDIVETDDFDSSDAVLLQDGASGQSAGEVVGNGHFANGNTTLVKDSVDYSKPVLWQVINLGGKYYEWTHQPISRDTLRLFQSDLLEYFSTSSWYAVPITWIPFIVIVCCLAVQQWHDVHIFEHVLDGAFRLAVPCEACPLVFVAGFLLWTLLEYILHRFLFHMEPPRNSKFLIGLHFVLHGQHHKVPFHPGRLVFPPLATTAFLLPYYFLMTAILPVPMAYILIAGTILGYTFYDLTHYYLHYGSPAPGSYLQSLKTYHVRHHYEIQDKGFGISSKLWDIVFGTLIPIMKED